MAVFYGTNLLGLDKQHIFQDQGFGGQLMLRDDGLLDVDDHCTLVSRVIAHCFAGHSKLIASLLRTDFIR